MISHALFFFWTINNRMKIQNLLEIIDTKVSTKQYSGKFREPDFEELEDRSNTGAYSSVKNDPHDPHMVIKHNHTPRHKSNNNVSPFDGEPIPPDGYQYFVKWMVENKIYNIHFPRVYDVTRYEDSEDQYIYKYEIEKLLKYDELDRDELERVIKMNFNVTSDAYKQAGKERQEITSKYRRKQVDPQDILSHVCSGIIRGTIQANSVIKNPEIKTALLLFADFLEWAKKNGYDTMEDLNPNNIMYRRTAQGLQIVLSDPVA